MTLTPCAVLLCADKHMQWILLRRVDAQQCYETDFLDRGLEWLVMFCYPVFSTKTICEVILCTYRLLDNINVYMKILVMFSHQSSNGCVQVSKLGTGRSTSTC